MRVYEPSFGAHFDVPINTMSKEQAATELSLSKKAQRYGISTPEISVCYSYDTKGERADYKTNKINKKHLDNLYKNIYLMDKINMNHNDLDIGHVFYADDGGVEFDCFRFASFFSKKPWQNYNLPEFMMPTNLINYENASLGTYLNQIPNQEEKDDFIKDYLIAGSKFHAKRAEFIEHNLNTNKRGVTPKMLEYEELQAFINRNPDDNVIRLREERLDFLRLQREAFTEWDEGNGACGHQFSKERRIKSIPMYLDALKSAINYSMHANKLMEESSDEDMKKYYEFEAQFGKYFANAYSSWIKGMAHWNFEDPKMRTEPFVYIDVSDNLYQKIIDVDFDKKIDAIDNYISFYSMYNNIEK